MFALVLDTFRPRGDPGSPKRNRRTPPAAGGVPLPLPNPLSSMTRRILSPAALVAMTSSLLASPVLAAPSSSTMAEAVPPAGASAPAMAAHELGQSYMFLRVHEDSLVVRVEIRVADVERALGFGWDPEDVTVDQVRGRLDSIRSYVEPRFGVSSAGTPLPTELADVDVRYLEISDYVVLTYLVEDLEQIPDQVDVLFSVMFEVDDDHRNLVVIEHNWKTGTFDNESLVSLVLTPRRPEQSLDLASGSVLQGFLVLVWLGVWHIWIGIDHILFLMALVLPSVLVRSGGEWKPVGSFKDGLVRIVIIVTFFTVAHSVTLSIAAFGVLQLPPRLVESVIAGSIAAAAAANLFPGLDVREWAIAFLFGLFHGFGFASVLGEIGFGTDYFLLSVSGFNVGVELGQLAVVGAVFPVLFVLRDTRLYPWILRVGSWFLIAVSLLWFFERVFEFNVPLIPLATAPFRWLAGLVAGA